MTKTKISIILSAIVAVFTACSPNSGVLKDGKPATPAVADATPVLSEFDREMSDMRTAGFQSIYVIRRKDGRELAADDRAFVKKRTEDANRRVATDAGKAIIVGMNRPPIPENISAIYDKFAVEAFNLPPPANATSPNQ